MAGSLREVKKKQKASVKAGRKDVLARCEKNSLIQLGPKPVFTRNEKLEKTWKALLVDPPINTSDLNQWRTGADVRPSGFPFCPRRYAMERLGLKMPSDFDVQSNYYTEVGKAIHLVVQNAFARTGRLWGFWKCCRPSCEDRIAGTTLSNIPGFFPKNKKCPRCKSDKFEYEELVIRDAKIGLRGHTDGVIVFKKFCSIFEIKSTGDEKVEALFAMTDKEIAELFMSEAPYYGYWHQAATYASLIRMKYPSLPPLKRVDYFIASRDNPTKVASFSLAIPEDDSWWGEIRSRILMAQYARDIQVLPRGFASNEADIAALPTCRWCSHKEVCLAPEGKVGYTSDALYNKEAHTDLKRVLKEERAKWVESFEEMSLTLPT